MNEVLKQIQQHWNQTADSDWYQSLRTGDRLKLLIQQPSSAFHPEVWRMLNQCLPELKGKKALLPSSGDNHAAFALALLGVQVTSTDISEKQLDYARQIAESLGLQMQFQQQDTAQLADIQDAAFDLVYTSNGTHTWIPDLGAMYRNLFRVLKPGGFALLYDTHPFQRPFAGQAWQSPQIVKPYWQVMPQCHWRVQDLVNAIAQAGFVVKEMQELPAMDPSFWFPYEQLIQQPPETLAQLNDWTKNPMAALPAWIAIAAQKPGREA